ncbi:ribonuclease H-like domain-containing protein [Diplogelasinospora grovesii]|uniref:ribonuclease H n=1 Tax=Diplogelasinospora grovesii TaxID=303347 RepID=A0AAN6NKN1_9PEZI|nr:ribonuclease H-like domain-containing protein [Diplogelasinospora grovesii]
MEHYFGFSDLVRQTGRGTPVDECGEEIERLFDPRLSTEHRRVPESQLIVYNTMKQVSQLQWLDPRATGPVPDDFTLVIRIDGACRGNGTPGARAAWAVYLGPGSRYNAFDLLRPALPQTSSRAEIEALVQALRIVRDITKDDFRLQQVRILSDSEYLVNAMGRWIPEWIEAGGRRANGKPVAHYQVLKEIHEKLDDMTYGDDGGLDFKFWHISREKNREADALANQALNCLD